MTCKICGKQLPEGSTVCKYCGARVKRPGETARPNRRRYSKKGMARKRVINLVIALLAVLLIAAVVFGIVWSTRQVGKTPDDAQTEGSGAAQNGEDPGEPPAEEPSVIPEADPEEAQEETPEETPEEAPAEEVPEETAEEPPADEISEQAPEEETPEETPAEEPAEEVPQPSTEGYTLGLNRTETTASLNHYRELEYYFNQELPAGVTVSSTSWVSSDDAVVRAEEGRAWGVGLGEATVTVTVNLSNGDALSAQCLVHVVESQIVTYSDYVLPESASRLYSAEELSGLSSNDLFIARNEIYARHGRIFTNPTLQQYFSGKSWYSGTIAPENFDSSVLNSYERQNVETILSVEASR